MVFRSFHLRIVIRVVILGVLMWVFIYALSRQHWYVATFTSGILIIASLVEMIRFLNHTNRQLGNFLLSIKHDDLTNYYPAKIPEKSFKGLNQAFNEVIDLYKKAKIDREVHYQYLQNVINHINTAVICYKDNGTIALFNQSARNLLGIKNPGMIDQISNIDKRLFETITGIRPGENRLLKTIFKGGVLNFSVFCTSFKLLGISYKLISLQNISNELEEHELESWQKLIRVLTHEIMNSVTPVSSLSTAMNELLTDTYGNKIPPEKLSRDDLDDLYRSLETIEDRSRWLLEFLGSYKNLTRLPKPDFKQVNVYDLLIRISQLMKKECSRNSVMLQLIVNDQNQSLCADEKMIQQVVINLINNAIDALKRKKNKRITIKAYTHHGKNCIHVADNGAGIDEENADKIFIPFFTTKKKGSGIGLNLARQIMRAHKGTIRFQSDKRGTIFTLEF
jgi:nitrogen fixation/metabolism regulation signal transduction histidine kinase